MSDANSIPLEDAALLVDSPEDNEAMRSLRAAYKKVKQESAELRKQQEQASAKQRETEVADALKAKGVDARAARFALQDGVDASKLDEWLVANGEVFGYTPASATPSTPAPEHEESAATLARINQTTATATPPDGANEIQQKMDNVTDFGAFKDFLKSKGAAV